MTDLSMRVAPVAAPVRQQVAEVLRAAITTGRFAQGQRLVEKDLCELTGVSRASVREALRQLESEGLIETLPNRGPLSLAALVAGRRQHLSGAWGARGAGRTTVRRACHRSAGLRAGSGGARPMELTRRRTSRHRTGEAQLLDDVLLSGSGNSMIGSILSTMNARITMSATGLLSSPKRAPASIREIRAVLNAIKKRDPQAAYEASLHHIQQAAKVALASLTSEGKS